MHIPQVTALVLSAAFASGSHTSGSRPTWGTFTPYGDNAEDFFGVEYVGLPDGCQVESVSTLQRHAQRFPGSLGSKKFANKVAGFVQNATASTPAFTGPLTFLNSYTYTIDGSGLLTNIGARTEFEAGVSFWNRYGRTLFDAHIGQKHYDASFPNGTARVPLVLRTTDQSRIENSLINWALGFFGPSYASEPNPSLDSWSDVFRVVSQPEHDGFNVTLSGSRSCPNLGNKDVIDLRNAPAIDFLKKYTAEPIARLRKFAPADFDLGVGDIEHMQGLCTYEQAYIGMSEFCSLFTDDEWAAYDNLAAIEGYYTFSFGNPTGRSQGIGYVQELVARLKHIQITTSNSNVNATQDGNPDTFPVNQKVYADFTHDGNILAVLTALSFDYMKDGNILLKYPPSDKRRFRISHFTPFGANLITETIGCSSDKPSAVKAPRIQYTPTQYGYDSSNAPHKFVRLRLNNGILPLNTLRGGACGKSGRKDGLCELDAFLETQKDSYKLSNYDYACFGNYTVDDVSVPPDYDGTIFPTKR